MGTKIMFGWALLLVCIIFGCGKESNEEVILEIGNYQLTTADLQSKRKGEAYRSLSDTELIDRLIQEGRILAYAQDRNYDTIPALRTLLNYAIRTYAARVDGFVWDKKVKPHLHVRADQLADAYAKLGQEYVLEVIRFADKQQLDSQKTLFTNFMALRKKAAADKSIVMFTTTSRYPYRPFDRYEQQISQATIGDILGPFETFDGYAVATVKDIKDTKSQLKSYAEEKDALEAELISCLRDKYIWENQKRILTAADPKISEAAVSELAAQKIDAKKQRWDGIDPQILLLEYTHQGQRIPFYVADFNEFIANTPVFFGSLSEPDDIKNLLRSYIIEEDLLTEAKYMDMLSDSAYLQFKKTYQEMLFVNHYKRGQVLVKQKVSPDAVREYYYQNTHRFKAFEKAVVDQYRFADAKEAAQFRAFLNRDKQSGDKFMQPEKMVLPKPVRLEIRGEDPKNSSRLVKAILSLGEGQISYPVESDGRFVVFVVHKKIGEVSVPLTVVQEDIRLLLQAEKEKQVLDQAIAALALQYPVRSNRIAAVLPQLKAISADRESQITQHIEKK